MSLTVAVQDAGRHGLNLFAENEALHILVSELKDQIKDPVNDSAGFVKNKEFWSNKYRETLKKLDALQWKHDGLLNSYNRILEDWSKLTGVKND